MAGLSDIKNRGPATALTAPAMVVAVSLVPARHRTAKPRQPHTTSSSRKSDHLPLIPTILIAEYESPLKQ